MEYTAFGKTNMQVSKLCLGTWEIGGGSVWAVEDDSESIRLIQKARELGVNFLDSAPLYGLGHAEEVIAKAIEGHRNDYIITSKCGLNWEERGDFTFDRDGKHVCVSLTKESVKRDFELCAKRLNTDYIDIFYTHRNVPMELVDECMEGLLELKQEGKIGAIGLSNMTRPVFDKCKNDIDAIQMEMSFLRWASVEEFLKECEELGITYHAYSILARGIFTGRLTEETVMTHQAHQKFGWFNPERRADLLAMIRRWQETYCKKYNCSLAALNLAWARQKSDSVVTIFGARHEASLVDTVASLEVSLSLEDRLQMEEDAACLRAKFA